MREKIYIKKNLILHKLKLDCPLDEWFYNMVQKSESELDILDISRMLRQKVYLDIAIPLAWERIMENPFCGEMYDGQLLEILLRVLISSTKNDWYRNYILLKKDISIKVEEHEWDSSEEKEEYKSLIKNWISYMN